MSNLDSNIFGKKKFSDLLKEIYDNQKKKEQQITALIGELKPLINDIGDATLIVPLIKEYMELGIKNDEQLVKMATIVQRAIASNKSEEEGFGMTEEEKAQLLSEVKKFNPKD
jgi:methanogenic corrinoid protein MtbC1